MGQNSPEGDSLTLVYENLALPDTVRLTALRNHISSLILVGADSTAWYPLKQRHDTWARSLDRPDLEAQAYAEVGGAFFDLDELGRARYWLTQTLERQQALKDVSLHSETYNVLGIIGAIEGDYLASMRDFRASLALRRELQDTLQIARSLNNLAIVYSELAMTEEALAANLESLSIKEHLADTSGMASSLNNIGALYFKQGDFQAARQYHERSLALNQQMGDAEGVGLSMCNVGDSYVRLGNLEEGVKYLRQGLAQGEALGDSDIQAYAQMLMARVFLAWDQPTEARRYAERSLALARQMGNREAIRDAAEVLYQSQQALGQWQPAFSMHQLFINVRDSLSNADLQKAALRQEFSQRLALDSLSRVEERRLQGVRLEEAAKRRRQQSLFWGIGLLVSLIFGVVLWNRLRLMRQQRNTIREQSEELNVMLESLHVAHESLSSKNQSLVSSLRYAQRIQEAILPSETTLRAALPHHAVLYKPRDIVAGDFYWLRQVQGYTLLAVADCTGHGVPGALVSVVCHHSLSQALEMVGPADPGKLLDKARELVIAEFSASHGTLSDGMDIAIVVMKGHDLAFAGAYNPLWLWREGDHVAEWQEALPKARVRTLENYTLVEVRGDKQPIGKFPTTVPFTTYYLTLRPGDTVYLFSDGFVDQFGGPNNRKFMASQLKALLTEVQSLTLDDQITRLDTAFAQWQGHHDQVDDVCIIGFRV